MLFTSHEIQDIRDRIKFSATELNSILKKIHYYEEERITADIVSRLNEPYMFVVVGEVKSGKSSFVNALLDPGKEICKVAASPMTDTIQQIVYGKPEREEYSSPYVKKIYQDNEILKEIAVVDTPGTNTIVDHHQEVTEKFVPVSDLIIFVFEAKNPYRQSSWEFFDFIKDEWRKNIIFILQQKDLLDTKDLETNIEGVKENARKKGIANPVVFAVSAKDEIEGHTNESGFIKLREYIESHITQGRSPVLKLKASVETLESVNNKLSDGMKLRIEQYESDFAFREEIKDILAKQVTKTNSQTDLLVESLVGKYDKISDKYEDVLSRRLGFFSLLTNSFKSIFDKSENLNKWLTNFTESLERELKDTMGKNLNNGIRDIADNIQMMAKLVDAKLHTNQTILTRDHHIFSDLAEKRSNILRDLMDTFSNFINREENFYDKKLMSKYGDISPDLLKGSGIAAIGIILAALTHGIVFDITGGVLTTIGFIFAGFGIGLKRKKIIRGFKTELEKGRKKLKEEIAEKIKKYVSNIRSRIDDNFSRFDDYLESEKKEIDSIENAQKNIISSFQKIKEDLNKKLV